MPETASSVDDEQILARPAGLGEAGGVLWDGVQKDYVLTAHERRLLLDACRLCDELAAIERSLEILGPVVTGSRGQQRPNPLLAEARAHRLAVKQLLAALKLRETLDAANANRAHAGRALVAHRWGNA